ncbi:OsmC family protein [Niveibacterium terrae]|uniref:OsmC family protein n=1 Tax=Niveibacterium terrae TaxID=3373598 RepID=UPI003A8CF03F
MIESSSLPTRYQTAFTNGGQSALADTSADKGGRGEGFRPHELLEAALACCMNMSLRMAAEKHAIPLGKVEVIVTLDRSDGQGPVFGYRVIFGEGPTAAQRKALLAALASCPVRKTLSQPLRFAQQQ